MTRKPKLISAPSARGGGGANTWRQQANTMFAYSEEDGVIGSIQNPALPDVAFEAPEDLNYERMVADRERELGLPATPHIMPGPVEYYRPPPPPVPVYTAPVEDADLSGLPEKFSLTIERKNDLWKCTSPVHGGLWKAGPDLPSVVHEALAALAEMVRIDGITKGRRK